MYTQNTRTVATSYYLHNSYTHGDMARWCHPIQTFYAHNQLIINNTYQTLTYQHQSKETNNIVHTKERQVKPKIQAQDLRSHIELKLEQNPRTSLIGKASTMQREHTWRQTSKVVDMPSMKLNYAIHSHTVSEYDRYKIRNWSKSQH